MYVIALFFTLIGLGIAVLPIVALFRQMEFSRRLRTLERELYDQQRTVDELRRRLAQTERAAAGEPTVPAAAPPAAATTPLPRPVAPAPPPARPVQPPTPAPPKPAAAPPGALPPVIASPPPSPFAPRPAATPPPPTAPSAPWVAFDWEQLVGVKLFSAIAGIALVLAAIFFFRYSLDRGWLAPTVRVAIGVVVAVALLVVCELRAAQKYRVTANALDAAAIAILFSTFFAAHSLWGLIPPTPTFGLLILVTAVAVLLSIRRESIFIAILGLAGGFATPALLSTGENRPIPLFTYLLLLNIGLAWVAVRKKWPLLTVLTLVLTTLYQWGWVIQFLGNSDLTLGMGIFLVFAVTSYAALTLAGRNAAGRVMSMALEQSGLAASAMPLLFAVFLSAVPAYGASAGLLFGFLLIVVLGIAVVAIARHDATLLALGGLSTLLVFGVWLATSYATRSWQMVSAFAVAFAAVFAAAPFVAARLRRPLPDLGNYASYVAPILLLVIAVIVRIEPQTEAPWTIFAAAFAILAIVAWQAFSAGDAGLYFTAAFFALSAEASWSATHFSPARLSSAVALYAAFALFYLGVPLAWRRHGRVMEPRWGSGAVLLASLAMLLFLAAGPRAATALWGLALLLAILDAGLFIESAAGRTPAVSMAGGLLSWVVLAVWWRNAGTAVGVLPSLLVIVGLTLIMFAGHAWALDSTRASAAQRTTGTSGESGAMGCRQGIYLGLVGQLFLFHAAQDVRWALPPWPLLAALLVTTLSATAASLNARTPHLHAAGVVAAAMVVLALALNVPAAWAITALAGDRSGGGVRRRFAVRETARAFERSPCRQCGWHGIRRRAWCRRDGPRWWGFDPSTGHTRACRQHFADLVAGVAAGLACRRHGGRGAGMGGDHDVAAGSPGAGRLAWHAGTRHGAVRVVCRLPADPPSACTQGSRPVSHGHPRQCLLLPCRPASAHRRSAPLRARGRARSRGHRAGVHAAPAASPGAGRPARPGSPGAGRGQRARICDRCDSRATHQSMDHDRLGARGCRARVAVPPCAAQGPALRRKRADGDRIRPPRSQSRDLRLRAPRERADPQLVSLRVRDLRDRDVRSRPLVQADRRSHCRRRAAHLHAAHAGRRRRALPAAQHRSRRFLRDRA
jgi:hypothetical protein